MALLFNDEEQSDLWKPHPIPECGFAALAPFWWRVGHRTFPRPELLLSSTVCVSAFRADCVVQSGQIGYLSEPKVPRHETCPTRAASRPISGLDHHRGFVFTIDLVVDAGKGLEAFADVVAQM